MLLNDRHTSFYEACRMIERLLLQKVYSFNGQTERSTIITFAGSFGAVTDIQPEFANG